MQNADPEQMFRLDPESVLWLASSIPLPYSTLRGKLSTRNMLWRTINGLFARSAQSKNNTDSLARLIGNAIAPQNNGWTGSTDRLLKCDDREDTLLTNWHWLEGEEEGGSIACRTTKPVLYIVQLKYLCGQWRYVQRNHLKCTELYRTHNKQKDYPHWIDGMTRHKHVSQDGTAELARRQMWQSIVKRTRTPVPPFSASKSDNAYSWPFHPGCLLVSCR